ncbi:hypothetical protein RJ639_004573 [Escallonia herrerae]|uniref:Uncharacterized protein n=1 Tax=Escallonia herrerae TaxID=1293975 RepID=A0AA88W1W8_9ASTE|nr:hypothetical protein RJ639_004573 [Escallonia herrerae]
MVLAGFMESWFLAEAPMRRSVSVKATIDGVVLLPRSLVMISTRPCCHTPTQDFEVFAITLVQVWMSKHRPTNKNHFVNHGLIHFGISQTMLNELEAISKEIHVKLLEPGSRNGQKEINSLKQAINAKGCLGSA